MKPSDLAFETAPADLVLETAAQIRDNAQRIYAQTVLADAMPLGNATGMTAEERSLLGAWIEQGATLPDK